MSVEFRLPDLGEGLPEAELVQWLVAEGDTVALNQTIAEVETAKAIVELPSPHAGTIRSLHASAGDVVPVGAVFVTFDVAGETAPPAGVPSPQSAPGGQKMPRQDADAASAPSDAEKAVPNLVGYGAAPRGSARPHRRARIAASARPTAAVRSDTVVSDAAPHDVILDSGPARGAGLGSGDAARERPRSTPPVRRRAKDLGIDLAQVAASGITGLITRADVDAFAARSPQASASATDAERGDRVTRTPIRGVRKHTADAMVRSAFSAPHVTTFLDVDITETTALISSLKADRALDGHRIGVTAVVAKAVCLALPRHPALNSRWDAANNEIVEHHYVNLGMAAATDRGLIVPNIPDADRMSLVDLADAIAELTTIARAGKTSASRLRGGTFSITNVGVFGIDAGTPILNPGEAGILALGAVRRRPWEFRDEIALRDVMTLSLSFDHRLVDGEQGARFLREVGQVLREPGRAMLLR